MPDKPGAAKMKKHYQAADGIMIEKRLQNCNVRVDGVASLMRSINEARAAIANGAKKIEYLFNGKWVKL